MEPKAGDRAYKVLVDHDEGFRMVAAVIKRVTPKRIEFEERSEVVEYNKIIHRDRTIYMTPEAAIEHFRDKLTDSIRALQHRQQRYEIQLAGFEEWVQERIHIPTSESKEE